MKRFLLFSPTFLLLGVFGAASRPSQVTTESLPREASPFAAVDVYIDPQGQPLAAYQFELSAPGAGVTLIGIEGGEHAAFTTPPYYDAKANIEHRIAIAAMNAGSDLPKTKTRVARIMVHINGPARPAYAATLKVAASPDATPIPATISIEEGARP